ncbi:DUF2919 domain-containing protein [Aliiglaciecola litoralis]|uniref:DUF2919 domain-containing protein n=1 Tax=Aliiglaciecola litoralis TaxID=582857 RepID=A0ABP3X0F0_9ALTE
MTRLLLPLKHYDEAGRVKPPRIFWWCGLLLAKSYFIFVLSLSNFRDADGLLEVFYPQQSELYLGFGIGFGAVIAMVLVAYREKWWNTKLVFISHLIKPLMFMTLALDLLHQVELAQKSYWQFSWTVALFVCLDVMIFYYIFTSRHIKIMLKDWRVH